MIDQSTELLNEILSGPTVQDARWHLIKGIADKLRGTKPSNKKPKRAQAPRPKKTPEERQYLAGLRKARNYNHQCLAKMNLKPGMWISFKGRNGEVKTEMVAVVIPPRTEIQVNEFVKPHEARAKWCHCSATRIGRYLMQEQEAWALGAPPFRLRLASEVESGLVEIHEKRPTNLHRLAEPLPNGTVVEWMGPTNVGPVLRKGTIIGFVPAGESLNDFKLPKGLGMPPKSIIDISNKSLRDRYVVICKESPFGWYSPNALTVERMWQGIDERLG